MLNSSQMFRWPTPNLPNCPTRAASRHLLFGGISGNLTIPVSNPFLNSQASSVLAGLGLGPSDSFQLQRFNNDLVDSGSRGSESHLWRIAAGLEGEFTAANRDFYWNVHGVSGQSTNLTTGQPIINNTRFLNAIEAVALTQDDVDTIAAAGSNPIGSAGDIVCQVTRDFARGDVPADQIRGLVSGSGVTNDDPVDVTACAPLNLFGEGAASPEALEYVVQRGLFDSDIEQSIYSASIGGQVFELPAGWIQASLGYEARVEKANFDVGGAVEVGLGRAAATPRTGGKYSTDEFFGEIVVPLISEDMNIPLAKNLEFEGSLREISNTQAGDVTVFTYGGTWTPFDGLSVKGNVTESVRAPSLTELFQPIVSTFEFADDPCDSRFINDGDNAANRQANCATDGIVQPFTSNVVNATAMGSYRW